MRLASGHVAEALTGEEEAQQKRDFGGYSAGLVRLTPGRWLFPAAYTKFADAIYNFKFRADDLLLMTYPKCGTTWVQELVWTLRNNPGLSHPMAHLNPNVRAPFIECDMLIDYETLPQVAESNEFMEGFKKLCPDADPKEGMFLKLSECAQDPRTLKTHLPFSLLPPDLLETAKVVYVAREPKDVVVSYHHHSRLLKAHDYRGSLGQFLQYFLDDDLLYSPCGLHLKEAVERRCHPNLHFVFYEDLKTNNMAEIRKLNDFLGTELTEEQLRKIATYTTFSEMKARAEKYDNPKDDPFLNQGVVDADGGFFRKGEAGSWKERLSPDQKDQIDQWTKKHITPLGLPYPRS